MPTPADPLSFRHGPTWQNRVALAPLTNTQSHGDGTLSDDEYEWLVARARGGFALTMTCAAYVTPAGQAWDGQLGIANDDHLPGLTRLATGLRDAGTHSAVQLHHGGVRADSGVTGRPLQGPWVKPGRENTAMTAAEIEQVVGDFTAGAIRAERAGFDGVEIHGAHGYLIGQFLDGRHNHRTDGYGGSLEDRSRFLFEILREIRRATGPTFQVGLRLTPEGNGIPVYEGREIARRVLESQLVDYLDMSLWDAFANPRSGGDRLLIDHFVDMPRHGTRLGVTGKVLSLDDAQWCLDRSADFVSVGMGAILHHDWAQRSLNDPDFVVRDRPVPATVLNDEYVSPTFVEYLRAGWDGLVA